MKVLPEHGAALLGLPDPGMACGGLTNRALELPELRCFGGVARTGNFNRAA